MGKASSAKKVARAAKAGGGRVSSGQPRGILFPGVLSLVVVLGVVLVLYGRSERQSEDLGGVPQIGDHIHLAFGVNICGEGFQPDIPTFESQIGIHTHGDGVIHVHPFSQLGVGANATLDRYFKDARDEGGLEIDISDSDLEWLGETFEEGEHDCEGVDDPQLRMAYWPEVTQEDSGDPIITTGDFGDQRLTENGAGITIFYGDPSADIPKPPTAPNLFELGAIDQGATDTTLPGDAGAADTPVEGTDTPTEGTDTPVEGTDDADTTGGAEATDDATDDADAGDTGDADTTEPADEETSDTAEP